jgi:type IV secretory pathway VirB2 component (pilin)
MATSTSISAHGVARSAPMQGLARAGLAARATVYRLIGVLALALALGERHGETDQRGALQALTQHTGGTVLVWLIAIGLFGYALWRFSEAALGVVGEGNKTGPRLQSLARGLSYLFLAISAVKVAAHAGAGSQAGQQELWTAKAMQHTGGRWIVGIVGAIIVVCGAVLVWEGIKHKFEKYFGLDRMTVTQRKVVEVMGTVGTAVRGVVFALAGVFVIVAAVKANPHKAGGLDQALRELLGISAGPFLVVLAGIGLIIFGLYGYTEAKWRKT